MTHHLTTEQYRRLAEPAPEPGGCKACRLITHPANENPESRNLTNKGNDIMAEKPKQIEPAREIHEQRRMSIFTGILQRNLSALSAQLAMVKTDLQIALEDNQALQKKLDKVQAELAAIKEEHADAAPKDSPPA